MNMATLLMNDDAANALAFLRWEGWPERQEEVCEWMLGVEELRREEGW